MANFIEYQLNGNTTILYPITGATYTPPSVTPTYATTAALGHTLTEDYNGAISIHVISTTSTMVLEVCNRDPASYAVSASPGGAPYIGSTALFTDTSTAGLWVTIQTMNLNTQAFAGTITAAGLYATPVLAFRNIRLRQTAIGASQVILGFGLAL